VLILETPLTFPRAVLQKGSERQKYKVANNTYKGLFLFIQKNQVSFFKKIVIDWFCKKGGKNA